MTSGRAFLDLPVRKAISLALCPWFLSAFFVVPAEGQLHAPHLAGSWAETGQRTEQFQMPYGLPPQAPPATPNSSSRYSPPQSSQQLTPQMLTPQMLTPQQVTPQQMTPPHRAIPALVPEVPLSSAPAEARQYAARPRPTEPIYLPLPGGYSLESPDYSPQVIDPRPYSLSDGASHSDGYHYSHTLPQQQPYWESPYPQGDQCVMDGTYQDCEPWTWTLLPKDLLWQSYIAGTRESRLAQGIVYLEKTGWLWELEAGGRAGLLRYGSGPGEEPEGWQLDITGGAFPRLNFEQGLELDAVDFKVTVPLTWRKGPFQLKLEWYHISAHVGDEFLLRNPGYPRLDYLRDSIVLGGGYFVTPDWRLYAEADYAYNMNGGAEPWHFQFGADYSPLEVTPLGMPVPFFGINGQIREEANYSGGVNVLAGFQWRGEETDHLFRVGLQYYNGQSTQFSFLGEHEELYGFGMWLDF